MSKNNTGYRSTGYKSTGDWSTGYRSTGHWSISKYSTGHFSTIDYSGFGSFNKPCDKDVWDNAIKPNFLYEISPTKWIDESEMTDQEKTENTTFHTTGGYLKTISMKEAWKVAWGNATKEDRDLLFKLPNFDAKVFKEISGIDVYEKKEETINVEGKDLTIAELKQMIKEKEGN
jgi:hypothetical protein